MDGSTVFATNLARWDGTNWSSVGSGLSASVMAVLASDTNLYVGGGFTQAGPKSAFYVAQARIAAPRATRTAVGTGNRSDPNTWTPTGVPADAEAVTIPTGFSVTVDVDTMAVGNLTVQGALAFTGNSTLKVSGNLTLESTVTFTPGTGRLELNGSGSQTLTATAPASLTFYNLKINKDAKTDVVTAASKLRVTKKLTVT
jgi:hypothetical protein